MKLEGFYQNIPIWSHPDCPPDNLYLVDQDNFKINYPKRKDGKLDMRYKINKIQQVFYD